MKHYRMQRTLNSRSNSNVTPQRTKRVRFAKSVSPVIKNTIPPENEKDETH